jgi:hypothetical protein
MHTVPLFYVDFQTHAGPTTTKDFGVPHLQALLRARVLVGLHHHVHLLLLHFAGVEEHAHLWVFFLQIMDHLLITTLDQSNIKRNEPRNEQYRSTG